MDDVKWYVFLRERTGCTEYNTRYKISPAEDASDMLERRGRGRPTHNLINPSHEAVTTLDCNARDTH